MQYQSISCSSLLFIINFLILFQSRNGSTDPDSQLYQKCGNTFSCGGAVTGIGYPFRGVDDPEYCGHPSLVLSCDNDNNATSIVIMGVKYRVVEIEQNAQSMRIAREDMMRSSCPTEMVNTTLDYSVFDYAASFMNYTFLYGCDPAPAFFSSVSCGAYVHPGAMGPTESCKASVVVPGPVMANEPLNTTALEESLQRGFEIRWKIGSRICSDCVASKGRCGYVAATNGTACYCADPPYVSSDVCAGANYGPPPTPETTSTTKSEGMYDLFLAF